VEGNARAGDQAGQARVIEEKRAFGGITDGREEEIGSTSRKKSSRKICIFYF